MYKMLVCPGGAKGRNETNKYISEIRRSKNIPPGKKEITGEVRRRYLLKVNIITTMYPKYHSHNLLAYERRK